MPSVFVDGIELEIGAHERLNGIQAAARVGIPIPHYCWHPGLTVVASCRMCLVESGRRDPATGQIQLLPKVVPACQTPATDGTVFITNSEKVKQARSMVEEDLLLRHPVDCPICDKAGECSLQDYHFLHGQAERRADIKPFTSRRRDVGETVTLFVDRCVMCTRCVRFTREVSGTSELMVIHRGSHEEIDVFPGYPLANKLSGCVVDLCPVGALGDRDFLYQQRVWFLRSHDHVCAGCSTGCSIQVEENQDRIYRLKPRENPQVNRWWMCDEGRYGWKYVHDPARVTLPRIRGVEGHMVVDWSEVPGELSGLLAGRRIAAALSPHLTVEEAYLLGRYLRTVDSQALLAVGWVPRGGVDERYPGGFEIHAEKCPNRRGVEEVVRHLTGEVLDWGAFLAHLDSGEVGAAWVTGGYPVDWVGPELVERLVRVPIWIVQDLRGSDLWEAATMQLPSAAFAEREGSFVNHADYLQSFRWAIRPPRGVLSEGQLAWRLLGRTGLYDAGRVLEELSREVSFFSAAVGGVGPQGVLLKNSEAFIA